MGAVHLVHTSSAVHRPAAGAGTVLASPCALVLTRQHLLTVKVGAPIGLGLGGKVKEVLSAVPVAESTAST